MRVVAAGVVTAVLAGPGLGAAAAPVEHEIELALEPQSGRLTVRDRVTVRVGATTGSVVEFVLNERLELDPAAPVEPVGEPFSAARFELNGHQIARGGEATIRRYRLTDPLDRGPFTIAYTGAMAFELGEVHEEYTRGFRETIGQLGPDGVYLTADSFWYPYFGDGLVEYRMTVEQPDGWHVISAGRGRSRDDDDRAQWESEGAVDEIYLAGGPLYLHRDSVGAVETLVYLHEDDPALSERYLTATAQYLEMYRSMIGPYAYSKFALVENFWETGYGMPSFTLLGPRVIRLPFILHSSYPHEILHNWWGNGVFVDYDSGNWCEGLTAYLADHLVQEQRGQGAAYRRDTLQKYRDYVGENRDFPLEQFRTRHSAATEAVGYGKSLVGFHMLRMAMGDDVFRRALAELYREYRGRRASFDDLRRVFESASGLPLADFFRQWLTRTGAPALAARVAWCDAGTTLRVCGTLEQTQSGPPFAVDVPIVLDTADGPQEHTVRMKTREQGFALAATTPVWRVRVDPSFDVLRLLDPRETPPTIGQLFGEPRILAVLPSSDAPRREAYRALVEGWRSASHEIEVVVDAELAALPAGLSVWVLGRQNRFAGPLFGGGVPRGFELLPTSTAFGQQSVSSAGHSIVSVRRHPASERHAVGLLDVDPEAAFPGIGRKLPHYGKYSYLAFAGDEPENVIKGQWPTDDSPLVVELAAPPDPVGADPGAAPAERSALAELPPLFSRQALGDHVDYLASRELEGRGVGTTGLDRAAEYVAARFAAVGLEPAGDDGYFQRFRLDDGPDGRPVELTNVVGYLPGRLAERDGQAVVVGAHYDHLGFGWPDAHRQFEGQLHPGADDNASGVAVLLELARVFAAGEAPDRALVFVAFTAEESGRLGSRHFVEHSGRLPAEAVRAMVNLDTVGRLGDGPVTVMSTGTAEEWPHIVRGVGFVTGIAGRSVEDSLSASDEASFIEHGVPAIQLFTAAHADYHRPSDTADKVDRTGLVKVATFAREIVSYLVGREEPLTVTIDGHVAPAGQPSAGRRVSFGIVPDFGFAGPGVRADSVVPDSPADRAGIRGGDVLTEVDGRPVADLRELAAILAGLAPGRSVGAVVERDGTRLELSVTLVAR